MNKSQLIENVAEKANISQKKAEDLVELIFKTMVDALVKNDRIEIRGLGSFITKSYKPYTGRNPRSGEKISVAPKRLPFFKVGKELKERVNAQ